MNFPKRGQAWGLGDGSPPVGSKAIVPGSWSKMWN